jgi:ATP-dependent RNA helicase RhlB
MSLARIWMKKDYHIVEIDPETVVSENVEQIVYMVTASQKVPIILWYLQNEDVQRMLIFTNRRDESGALADALYEHGIDLELLTGDVPQRKRMTILERFRSGELKVVVATDVAGRGIHVDNVSHVINFELPYEPEDYVHRVGRTGRAGVSGRAISFACENSAFELPSIEEYIGSSLKCTSPEECMLEDHEKVRKAPARKPLRSNSRSRNTGGHHGGNRGGNRNHRGGGRR